MEEKIEKKDKLTAEIQIVTVISFLFTSCCAGLGALYFQPEFANNIFLQCISIILVIFTIGFGLWGLNVFLEIERLKNE